MEANLCRSFIVCLYLYLEIQLSRGEGFNPATLVCLSQLRDGFPLLYVQVFFVFNDLRWEILLMSVELFTIAV